MRSRGWRPHHGTSVLMGRGRETGALSWLTQIRGSVSTQHDGALTKNLDLGLPRLQTVRKNCLLSKPPSQWCSDAAAEPTKAGCEPGSCSDAPLRRLRQWGGRGGGVGGGGGWFKWL